MRQIEGYDLINEAGEFKKLPAGVYPLVIKEVLDRPEKNYLEIHFDICGGEYKNYFATTNNGYGTAIRSYSDKALPFFKAFITAVEKTNTGYKWNWDEKSLSGKNVIGVFGEEEYLSEGDNGLEVRVSCKLQEFRSKEAYLAGKCVVPQLKKLSDEDKAKLNPVSEIEKKIINDDLPF